ncbi:MAG: DNA repair protein RadC [Bacteroidales bacterium]|nr:DNA repair protein RadC [Bacteroidales bacterium]
MEEKTNLTVKEWADEDRPRERMLQLGKKQLSNAELIAILLRSGVVGKSAVDVAKEVLATAGNSLTTLSRLDYSRLSGIRGLGTAKATTLMAALELGWRMQSEISDSKTQIISDSTSLFNYMLPLVADIDHEEFWAVYMSMSNRVLSRQRIASGGQTDTPVDIRILFRGALDCKAVKLAVVHNHPSGSVRPSSEDRTLTRRISEAGQLLQIKLTEHIIIGGATDGKPDYYSFHDNGAL